MTKKYRKLDMSIDDLSAVMDNEGVDYFLTQYSGPEFWEGTKYEGLYNPFIDAREAFLDALREDGVEC